MRALIVLPTFQEAENIAVVLPRIRAAAPDADVLVVDDDSPDGTADLAEESAADLGAIKVLRRAAKDGLGRAYLAGFGQAVAGDYDVVVAMDADLSHDPAVIPGLVAAVESGADLAIGSRYIAGGAIPRWPLHRRALSRWGNRYATAALGLPVHDATSGFRCYRTGMLRRIDLETVRSTGYGFQIELVRRIAARGGRLAEVPIVFVDRERGTSKMSSRIVVEAMVFVTSWAVRERMRGLGRRLRHRLH